MTILEIRDPDEAREHLLAGLWLSRAVTPSAESLAATLAWLLELSSEGHPAPPIGFLADAGHLALGSLHGEAAAAGRELPGIEAGLVRRYEDYVLGKLYADLSFERAADALLRYAETDRPRGLAYLIHRLLVRTGAGGVLFSPAVVRSLAQRPADEVLRESWQLLSQGGPTPAATEQIEQLIDRVKSTGDLLTPEDIFELEHGTALIEFGERLALRQTLRTAELLAETLPHQRPRSTGRRRQVATRLLEEDAYPVGGFSSISTKGTIESLLHSQLAYIEPDERPDLFDIKFVRDELLYYSRDENQFLRRRTTILVILAPELAQIRIKDAGLPYQRIILVLGLVVAVVRKLTEWLSDEALQFRFIFPPAKGEYPLADEQALLELIFREEMVHGTVAAERLALPAVAKLAAQESRRSFVRCLAISPRELKLALEHAEVLQLVVGQPQPGLWDDDGGPFASELAGIENWQETLATLLSRWV
jgi:hypothetical protein